MHHPTDSITHTTTFVTPVVEHLLEWNSSMKNRSNDPLHHSSMKNRSNDPLHHSSMKNRSNDPLHHSSMKNRSNDPLHHSSMKNRSNDPLHHSSMKNWSNDPLHHEWTLQLYEISPACVLYYLPSGRPGRGASLCRPAGHTQLLGTQCWESSVAKPLTTGCKETKADNYKDFRRKQINGYCLEYFFTCDTF